MRNIIFTFFLLFFLLNFSCVQENKLDHTSTEESEGLKEAHYIITSLGDSIQSGVPLRGKGKVIDPKEIASPKTVSMGGKPNKVPVQTNVYPAGQSKVITFPKDPRVIIIGEDGVPFPKTVDALGQSIPAIQPPQLMAGTPQMKQEAISNIQFWNKDQGLNTSYITDMLEDSRGHIWFITKDGGVSRFDGNHFTHYTIKEGLPFNDPICMMEDSKGNIWIGGFQGLIRYNGDHFTHYTQKDGLEDVVIYSMMEDSRGNLWFAGHGHLTEFDPGLLTFTHYNSEHGFRNNLPIRAMHEDKHGVIWIGQIWGGLYRFEPEADSNGGKISHYSEEHGFGRMVFSTILEDSRNNLWFGTSNGAYQLDITTSELSNTIHQYTTDEGLTNGFIYSILEDREGNIWFGTKDGVNQLDLNNENAALETEGIITHYTQDQGLSNNDVRNLLEDDQGNIWMGTEDGLNRYMESRFKFIRNQELSKHPIQSILEDQRGDLWFGGSNARSTTLTRLEESLTNGNLNQNLALLTDKEGFGHYNIQSMTEDRQGRLWMGLYNEGGVCRYDPGNDNHNGTFTYYNTKEGLLTSYVHAIRADRQGNIWIGGVGGLACHIPPTDDQNNGRFIHFTREEGFPSFVVLSILEDSRGNLWFGTQRGVSRYTPDKSINEGTFTHFTSHEGLSSSWITSIMEDSDGNIWLGSYSGGASRFDPSAESEQRFIQFTTEDGLSHNIVQSILEDDQNNIWISTQKGLNMLKPKSRDRDTESTSEKDAYHIYSFGQEDGLKNIDFAKGVSMDQKRRIWWGTNHGVAKLELDQFKFSSASPNLKMATIEIEQAYIDYRRLTDLRYSKSITIGEVVKQGFDSVAVFSNYPYNLVLPYNLNHLTFRFTATDWTAPHKIQYSYWMEGIDKNWTMPVLEPMADYRNLPHGRHTLKVRAIGEAQIWSEPFEYNFRIMPPWWFSPWAYVIYALVAVGSIWGFLQWRMASLRKRQKNLEKIVTDRTAEVVAQKEVILQEKNRSEQLLLNILPADIAEELKSNGKSPPRDFEQVTVMFTDFKEFTSISERMSAQELVSELNVCFEAFDEIITKYQIEKIKTIGDAYMAAGGLHLPRKTEPKAVVMAALEMQQFIYRRQKERKDNDKLFFEMRCGIHTGAVVAGIVGVRKFQYDIWGDTVNLASRMESNGQEGRVNISRDTYELIKDQPEFKFESRGKVDVKNKGALDMYFVQRAG